MKTLVAHAVNEQGYDILFAGDFECFHTCMTCVLGC